jgi:hypothetical protein
MENAILPLSRFGARRQEDEVFDGLANGREVWNGEYSGDMLAGLQLLVCDRRHRLEVVCDKNSAFRRCPRQNLRIGCSAKIRLLHGKEVCFWQTESYAAEDAMIEVLVEE